MTENSVYIDHQRLKLSRILIFVIVTLLFGDILGFVQTYDGVGQGRRTLAFSS